MWTPSEEERALLDLVQKFSLEKIRPVISAYEEKGEFPKSIFEELASLSLLGMLTPEKYQGVGLNFLTYAAVLEEISKSSLSVAVSLSVTGLPQFIISTFGNDLQKEKFLPDLATGKKLGAFSLTESGSGSDAAALKMRAQQKGDSYILNGTKAFVTNGSLADTLVVFARTSQDKTKGISAFIVEKGDFHVSKIEKKMALDASLTTEIIFKDTKISEKNLIGGEGDGFLIAMQALNGGRITMGACAVGLATRAFEEAKEYVKMRHQFGKPLSVLQGIQLILADMATGIESSRLLVQKAATLRDQGKPFIKEASMAKVAATDMAMQVTTKAVQLFGGNGYCQDYPVERFMREAKVLQIVEGTNQIQRLVIAKQVLQ